MVGYEAVRSEKQVDSDAAAVDFPHLGCGLRLPVLDSKHFPGVGLAKGHLDGCCGGSYIKFKQLILVKDGAKTITAGTTLRRNGRYPEPVCREA